MIKKIYLKKNQHLLLKRFSKFKLLFINLTILTSLSYVILKNIQEIRFTHVSNESGKIFILDRFKSVIREVD